MYNIYLTMYTFLGRERTYYQNYASDFVKNYRLPADQSDQNSWSPFNDRVGRSSDLIFVTIQQLHYAVIFVIMENICLLNFVKCTASVGMNLGCASNDPGNDTRAVGVAVAGHDRGAAGHQRRPCRSRAVSVRPRAPATSCSCTGGQVRTGRVSRPSCATTRRRAD